MTLFLFLSALAAEPRWAGIPLTRLPGLALSEPSLSARASVWQAADSTGGWARVYWYADEATAQTRFTFLTGAATTLTQPALTLAGAEQAVGGDGYVLARSRNVVIEVRRSKDGAPAQATAMLAALAPEGTAVTPPATVDAAVWDGFGRRLAELAR